MESLQPAGLWNLAQRTARYLPGYHLPCLCMSESLLDRERAASPCGDDPDRDLSAAACDGLIRLTHRVRTPVQTPPARAERPPQTIAFLVTSHRGAARF